jgi:hypothetical protein
MLELGVRVDKEGEGLKGTKVAIYLEGGPMLV